MKEAAVLEMLDMLGDRAKDFVQVSDEVIHGERALQSQDGVRLTSWQVCSVLSAFINFVAEGERLRYGHFACDLDRKNCGSDARARATLRRMSMFWEQPDTDDIDEEQADARAKVLMDFAANDDAIRKHLYDQPDMYQEGVPQETHRAWSLRLRLMVELEVVLLKEWDALLKEQRQKSAVPAGQQP